MLAQFYRALPSRPHPARSAGGQCAGRYTSESGTSLAGLGRPFGAAVIRLNRTGWQRNRVTAGDPALFEDTSRDFGARWEASSASSPTNLGRVLYPIRTCIEAAPDAGFPARFRLTSRRTVSACATAHRRLSCNPLFRRLRSAVSALSPFAHAWHGQRQTPPPTRAAWLMDHDRDVSWCGAVVDDDGQPFG